MNKELRCFDGIELRVEDGAAGGMPVISGYAARFNVLSNPLGPPNAKFREVILPGAFSKALANGADVRALWDHETSQILGRTKSGTLKLAEDEKGLRFSFTPPDTQVGRDAVASIRRGDVDGMSFGFRKVQDKWTRRDGENIRELIEVEPFDVSPTAFPAYAGTEIDLRSTGAAIKELDTEHRGQVPGSSSVVMAATDARQYCRNAFDVLQRVIDVINATDGVLNEQEVQAIADLDDEMDDLCGKLEQCDDACDPYVPDDEPEPDDAPDAAMRSLETLTRKLQLAEIGAIPFAEVRAGHMSHGGGVSLNGEGLAHARSLIEAGKVSDDPWTFTGADGDKLMGDNDWKSYGKWFLATVPGTDPKTKEHYKYPFGKDGKAYRRAVAAIRSRASQQSAGGVFKAAGELMDMIDKKQA